MKNLLCGLLSMSLALSTLVTPINAEPLEEDLNSNLFAGEESYTFDLSQATTDKMTYADGVLTYAPSTNGYQVQTLDVLAQKSDFPTNNKWAKLEYDVMVSDYESIWSAGMANYIDKTGKNIGGKDDNYGIFDILPIEEEGSDVRVRSGAIGTSTWAPNRYSGAAIYAEDEWNHVEYYADLSGSTAKLTMRINDQNVKNDIDSTITDMSLIGNLHFGFKNACIGNTIKVKNVVYSWEKAPEATATPTASPNPTPTPGAVNSYTFDFKSGANIGDYGFGSPNSVHGYDEAEDAGYFETKNSQIQYKIKGQSVVPVGFKWYKVSTTFKFSDPNQVPSFMRMCESIDGEYDNLIFQGARTDSGCVIYGSTGKTSAGITYDFTEYHKFDIYANDEDGVTRLYIYIDDEYINEFENELSSKKFGLMFFQTTADSTVKGWIKECVYSWSNESILPDPTEPTEKPDVTPTPTPGREDEGIFDEHDLKYQFKYDLTKNVYPERTTLSTSSDGILTIERSGANTTTDSGVLLGEQQAGPRDIPNGAMWQKVSFDLRYPEGYSLGLAKFGIMYTNTKDQLVNADLFVASYLKNHPSVGDYITTRYIPGDHRWDSGNDIDIRSVGIDWSNWTHFEYWVHNDGTSAKVYMRVKNGDIKGPVDTTITDFSKISRLYFTSDGVGAAKLNVKNVIYSYNTEDDPNFAGAIAPKDVNLKAWFEETGANYEDAVIKVTNATVGKKYNAVYDEKALGDYDTVELRFTTANGTTREPVSFGGNTTISVTPDTEGVYTIVSKNGAKETILTKVVAGNAVGSLSKLANKGNLKVAYLGGSITVGSGSADVDKRWSTQVTKYLTEKIPGTTFTEINAGIGGTPSQYGILRLQRDVLSKKPDIVFVEFAVNDVNIPDSLSASCYEGIIRKLMEAGCMVVCVGVVSNKGEVNRSELHKNIAHQYGLQYIDVEDYINADYGKANRGTNTDRDALYNDETHPNDAGYTYYSKVIENALNDASFVVPDKDGKYLSSYVNFFGTFINAKDMQRVGGWTASGTGDWNQQHLGGSGSSLSSASASASLSYTFKGTAVLVGSRIGNSIGNYRVSIDGAKATEVNGYYNSSSLQPVIGYYNFSLEDGEHTITITPVGNKSVQIDFIAIPDQGSSPQPTATPTPTPEPTPEPIIDGVWEKYHFEKASYFDTNVYKATYTNNNNDIEIYKKILKGPGQLNEIYFNLYDYMPQSKNYTWNKVEADIKFSDNNPDGTSEFRGGFFNLIHGSSKDNECQVVLYPFYNPITQTIDVRNYSSENALLYASATVGNMFEEYVHMAYWIYHPTTGKDMVFIEIGDTMSGPFTVDYAPVWTKTPVNKYNRIMVTPDNKYTGESIYLKNFWAYGGTTPEGFEPPCLTVTNTTIADGTTDVEFSDTLTQTIDFNAKLNAKTVDIKSFVTFDDKNVEYTVDFANENKSLVVSIKNPEYGKEYNMTVARDIPFAEGQYIGEFGLIQMGMSYVTKFKTWPASFESRDTLVDDSSNFVINDNLGKTVTVKTTLENHRYDNAPATYMLVAIKDNEGRLYGVARSTDVEVSKGESKDVSAELTLPSEAGNYKIEVFTLSGNEKTLTMFPKYVLE